MSYHSYIGKVYNFIINLTGHRLFGVCFDFGHFVNSYQTDGHETYIRSILYKFVFQVSILASFNTGFNFRDGGIITAAFTLSVQKKALNTGQNGALLADL